MSTEFYDVREDDPVSIWRGGDANIDIEFNYEQPNISVDSSARYVDHEIIGGMTVRQRIGEDPKQVSLSGVCTKEEARQIDQLYTLNYARFHSYRTGTLTVQITSASTDPYNDGGAFSTNVDSDNDTDIDTLHQFTINLVEVSDDTF